MLTVRPGSRQNLANGSGDDQSACDNLRSCGYRGGLLGHLRTETVRVVYSDESGVGSKDEEPIVVIAALMINVDEQWTILESELEKIKAETPAILLHEEREFKGSLLYGAIRKSERLRAIGRSDSDLEKAREVLARLLDTTNRCSVPIFYGATDRIGYERYKGMWSGVESKSATEHDVAFDACFARVDRWAHGDLPREEKILWIHDHRGKEEEEQTKLSLHWTRFLKAQGWNPITLSYEGRGQNQSPPRVVDAIYFGHSHDSSALQLAYVCCSTITLRLLERFYPEVIVRRNWQPLVEPFYAMIRNGVVADGTEPLYLELTAKK